MIGRPHVLGCRRNPETPAHASPSSARRHLGVAPRQARHHPRDLEGRRRRPAAVRRGGGPRPARRDRPGGPSGHVRGAGDGLPPLPALGMQGHLGRAVPRGRPDRRARDGDARFRRLQGAALRRRRPGRRRGGARPLARRADDRDPRRGRRARPALVLPADAGAGRRLPAGPAPAGGAVARAPDRRPRRSPPSGQRSWTGGTPTSCATGPRSSGPRR